MYDTAYIGAQIAREGYTADMPAGEKLVTTTDLARNYRKVLDAAAKGPVSIPREQEKPAITLVARDMWQQASCAEQWIAAFAAIVYSCLAIMSGNDDLSLPYEFEWLREFDKDDVAEFLAEFSDAMRNATAGVRSWEEVEAVLHEWHHSALAIRDEELQARFKQARSGFTHD